MATTVTAPVNNNIALASKYLPILDEIYKRGSLTSVLDTANERVRWVGAKTAYLFNIQMVGLGNYDRNKGFVSGDTNGSWEPYTINIDRGRSYMVDTMDNDETLGMAFGSLLGEAQRTQFIPETDAYRFAKYADGSGMKATPTTIGSSTNIADMIDEAESEMNDAQVPFEGRILFVSSQAYRTLRKNITRYTQNGAGNVNNMIEIYNDMRIIQVPQSRFNTGITLNAATNPEDVGGYTLSGVPINFMIVHPSAVLQVIKHVIPRTFSPEVNQEADAWKFDFRIYHDCWVEANKANGIYLAASAPSTAMSLSKSASTISGTASDTVTVSNAVGTVNAVSNNIGVCTASASGATVTITGVKAGSTKVVVTDGIGQSAEVSVTVS